MTAWRAHALCKGQDPAMFVPGLGGEPSPAALVFCAACPVRIPCREFARSTGQLGVWGGEDDAARQAALDLPASRRVRKPQPG